MFVTNLSEYFIKRNNTNRDTIGIGHERDENVECTTGLRSRGSEGFVNF